MQPVDSKGKKPVHKPWKTCDRKLSARELRGTVLSSAERQYLRVVKTDKR